MLPGESRSSRPVASGAGLSSHSSITSSPAARTLGTELREVALEEGRRPHVLFGTKELEENRPPIFLPPLLHSAFLKYKPEEGQLTKEAGWRCGG